MDGCGLSEWREKRVSKAGEKLVLLVMERKASDTVEAESVWGYGACFGSSASWNSMLSCKQ